MMPPVELRLDIVVPSALASSAKSPTHCCVGTGLRGSSDGRAGLRYRDLGWACLAWSVVSGTRTPDSDMDLDLEPSRASIPVDSHVFDWLGDAENFTAPQ